MAFAFDRAAKKVAAEKGYDLGVGTTPSFSDIFKAAHDSEMSSVKPTLASHLNHEPAIQHQEPQSKKKGALRSARSLGCATACRWPGLTHARCRCPLHHELPPCCAPALRSLLFATYALIVVATTTLASYSSSIEPFLFPGRARAGT